MPCLFEPASGHSWTSEVVERDGHNAQRYADGLEFKDGKCEERLIHHLLSKTLHIVKKNHR